MKLQILLQREDFITIFKNTFSNYLSDNFDWDGEISWVSLSRIPKRNYFLVNQRLNLIYPSNLNRSFLDPLKNEYVYHKNPVRHALQKLYAKMSTCLPFELMFSTAIIEIDPWLEELESWCILPGNHSLRILNFDQQVCTVILKYGFNQKFLENEIAIRNTFSHPTMPKLTEVSTKGHYYVEERIQGVPINRLGKHSDRMFCLQRSRECLSKLYDETRQMSELQEWLSCLQEKLKDSENLLRNDESDQQWSEIIAVSLDLHQIIERGGLVAIPTTRTHGDFQPANIIHCNKGKTYLIDWEYSARRFEPYDQFVYFFQTRFPDGLASRLSDGCEISKTSNPFIWPMDLMIDGAIPSWMMALLLFEDLLVRVGELSVPNCLGINLGLEAFLRETKVWITKNQNCY